MSTLAALGECSFTLQVQVNEPANVTAVLVADSHGAVSVTSKDLLTQSNLDLSPFDMLAQTDVVIEVGKQGKWHSAGMHTVQCGLLYQVCNT